MARIKPDAVRQAQRFARGGAGVASGEVADRVADAVSRNYGDACSREDVLDVLDRKRLTDTALEVAIVEELAELGFHQ